jgi:hypothetical protein
MDGKLRFFAKSKFPQVSTDATDVIRVELVICKTPGQRVLRMAYCYGCAATDKKNATDVLRMKTAIRNRVLPARRCSATDATDVNALLS